MFTTDPSDRSTGTKCPRNAFAGFRRLRHHSLTVCAAVPSSAYPLVGSEIEAVSLTEPGQFIHRSLDEGPSGLCCAGGGRSLGERPTIVAPGTAPSNTLFGLGLPTMVVLVPVAIAAPNVVFVYLRCGVVQRDLTIGAFLRIDEGCFGSTRTCQIDAHQRRLALLELPFSPRNETKKGWPEAPFAGFDAGDHERPKWFGS